LQTFFYLHVQDILKHVALTTEKLILYS
jgi:hypothetical protein